MACDRVVSDLMHPLWEEVLWPFLDASDSVRLHTTSTQCYVPGETGRMASSSSSFWKRSQWSSGSGVGWGPASGRMASLSSFLMQKKPSEAFNSYIGDGFLVPELKDESEAWKDEQADSSSEKNVGKGALFVIGLHRSGDTIALFLKTGRWQRQPGADVALDMLCQELHEVERRRGCLGF